MTTRGQTGGLHVRVSAHLVHGVDVTFGLRNAAIPGVNSKTPLPGIRKEESNDEMFEVWSRNANVR
jgi:hypothetical protein